MNHSKLEQLKGLLKRKQSQKTYAKLLNVSETDIKNAIKQIREAKDENEDEGFRNYEEDMRKERGVVSFSTDREIQTLDDLIEIGKIDITKWTVDKYIQNSWGNSQNQKWQVKAWLSPIIASDKFAEQFTEALSKIKPLSQIKQLPQKLKKEEGYLILNKQDAHYNKFDVNGKNDIYRRFEKIEEKMANIVSQAVISSNLNEIIYVIGSDAFNSEWTLATTKGTPQTNILTYTESFNLIVEHEVRSISHLVPFANKVKVVYVPGNHDEYVGWHLINTLSHFFSENPTIEFSESIEDTKCFRVSNTAIMFNHGDVMKSRDLAGKFPILFKDEWSKCDQFYIFTGDKHHLKAEDINGIQFFQLPSLSQAKSRWDMKQGHICTDAEMMAFLIKQKVGMTNIYKEKI